MAIVKNDSVIDQEWITIDAEADLPPGEENIIVPLARFKEERETLIGRNGGLGVQLNPGDAPEDLANDLDRLSIIAVNFPAYTDGRGYSYARVLRERLGFKGELREIGDVLRDQILYMHRCGFDAYELKNDDDVSLTKVRAALKEMTVYYQPTGDGRVTAGSLRDRPRHIGGQPRRAQRDGKEPDEACAHRAKRKGQPFVGGELPANPAQHDNGIKIYMRVQEGHGKRRRQNCLPARLPDIAF